MPTPTAELPLVMLRARILPRVIETRLSPLELLTGVIPSRILTVRRSN